MKTIANEQKKQRFVLKSKVYDQLVAYAFLLPAILFYLIFKYIPIGEGLFVSFFKVNIVNLPGKFIGFENYARALADADFWASLFHNLKFFIYGLVFGFWPPILAAFLINEITGKWHARIKVIYYIPAIVPAMAMNVIMKYFWQPDYGLANFLIQKLGLPPQLWLNDVKWVYFCMSSPSLIFGMSGFLVYLAAIKEVPEEIFEAAIIDGAGFWRRVFNIALPQIRHIVIMLLIMNMISVINSIDNVLVMTGGGPAGSTSTAILYAYRQAVDYNDYGYAIAMANIVMVIVLIITICQLKLTNKNGEI